LRHDNPRGQSGLEYPALKSFDITSVPLYDVPIVSRKKRKPGSKVREKTGLITKLKTDVAFRVAFISLIITAGFSIYFAAFQQPKLDELERIKHDFPMVQNIYEAGEIAKAIPLPEPLEPTENLDYFPAVLLNTAQAPIADLESIPYGYALRLVTSNNIYLATDSPEESTEKTVVFSMGELREKRKKLTWFLYEGPFPPEGWTEFR